MSKMYRIVVSVIVVIILLSGCGSKSSYETTDSMSSAVEYATEEAETASMESPSAAPMEAGSADAITYSESTDTMSNTNQKAATNSDLQQLADNRKYIRTFDFQIETLVFDTATQSLEQLVDQYFGFFQSTEVTGRTINNNSGISRQGIYTIRIPKEKVGDFLKGLVGIGNVLDSSSFVDDVTNQYMDLDARIKTLKVQEERLIAILEDADELQYILELERELSSVRYQIESYMSNFRDLDNRINYSTVNVRLYEVFEPTVIKAQPTTFMDKIRDGFTRSLNDAFEFIQNIIIFLITNIPTFIVIAVNLLILYGIIRLVMRTKLFKKVFMMDSTNKHITKNSSNDPHDQP